MFNANFQNSKSNGLAATSKTHSHSQLELLKKLRKPYLCSTEKHILVMCISLYSRFLNCLDLKFGAAMCLILGGHVKDLCCLLQLQKNCHHLGKILCDTLLGRLNYSIIYPGSNLSVKTNRRSLV